MPLFSFQPEGKCKIKLFPLGELFNKGVEKTAVAEQKEHESRPWKNKTL